MIHDIVIVGAGPSGSVAAINLARQGLRPLVLDKAAFPRLKPCGGGISGRAFERFSYLSHVFEAASMHLVHRVVFAAPSGNSVEIKSEKPFYGMIRRIEFDALLVEEARKLGVEVREDCAVKDVRYESDHAVLLTDNGEVHARLVIAADGVNSTVALRSGLRRSWTPDQLAIDTTEESPLTEVKCDPDAMYVYYGANGGFGYSYVFPKRTHVNFGIGYQLSYFKKAVGEHPLESHRELFRTLSHSGVLNGESNRANIHSYLIPLAGPAERVSGRRTMLIGDAGGFVNAFTAEGIFYAMVSGEVAARTAALAVRKQDYSDTVLSRFDREIESDIGGELRESVSIQKRLLTSSDRVEQIVEIARQNPKAAQLLADFAVGRIGRKQFKRRMAFTTLPQLIRNGAKKLLTASAR